MKKLLFLLLLCVAGLNTAQAAVVIDPTTGLDSTFIWNDGLGIIDGIDGTTNTEWSINAAVDSTMALATAVDGFVVGDEFGLILDGVATAWTSTFYDTDGYFHGVFDNLFLSAGIHTISFELTKLAAGWTTGAAYANFSGITAVPVPAVPIPAAVWLFGSSLIGLIGLRKRAKKVSALSAA